LGSCIIEIGRDRKLKGCRSRGDVSCENLSRISNGRLREEPTTGAKKSG
jgi:hypothetical protein